MELFKIPTNKNLYVILQNVKKEVKNYKKNKKKNTLKNVNNSLLFNI